ncbi:MAG: hypothetical protein J7L26_12605 [Candidatus Aminicenantes bacterium]|nr:hypothetical protein [Candidatus Aminicenantes bacterium]
MNEKAIEIIWFGSLTFYLFFKDLVVPMWKKIQNNHNHKKNNPVNIPMFYQEFRDFKEIQKEWNEKIEKRVDEIDKRIDNLEKEKAARG